MLLALAAAMIPLAWEGTAKVYDGERAVAINVRSRVEASGRVVSESWPTEMGETKGLRRLILEPNGTGRVERDGRSEPAPADFVTEENCPVRLLPATAEGARDLCRAMG